ncbi:hypothetical protein D3C85_1485500 [compost metagenome]
MVLMQPGGSGGSTPITPFSPGPTSSPVASLNSFTLKPYTGSPGLPNLTALGSTPLHSVSIGQPVSVCQ